MTDTHTDIQTDRQTKFLKRFPIFFTFYKDIQFF
ncbi:uncharacterized protein METZ01_LOCUS517146 [marine metagenome]|uniref:Uncharacterized protein n=1 Tax=marine metagenome TaxID=408172 RepID=A0A383F538_9ZZZZ